MVKRGLIIGLGEVGKAVQETVCPDAATYDTNTRNYKTGQIDVMHICFPYSDKFVQQVKDYRGRYEPDYIAIWSTVPIGTTKKIGKAVIHTPVEGKHPKLARSIKLMPRWVGHNSIRSADFFNTYFADRHLKVKLVPNTDHTEALKLLSTTEYGINIIFADYKARVAHNLDMDFELTKEFNRDYNQLYRELGLDRHFQKFVLDPPNGKIGGHCLAPNAKLINEQYPDDWVERLISYGD